MVQKRVDIAGSVVAKDVIMLNGSASISVTDVRKCIDWLGTMIPDVLNGLQSDEDSNALERIFRADSSNIVF